MSVKIFASGFVRTHRAFVDQVIVTQRPWRQYVASRDRLMALDHAAQEQRMGAELHAWKRFPAYLEWWMDNFTLYQDLRLRRFPARWVSTNRCWRIPKLRLAQSLSGFKVMLNLR